MPEEVPFVETEVVTPEELAAMRKTVTKIPLEAGIGVITNDVFWPIVGVTGDGRPSLAPNMDLIQEFINPDDFDLEEVFD